jgi:hypothetical protein
MRQVFILLNWPKIWFYCSKKSFAGYSLKWIKHFAVKKFNRDIKGNKMPVELSNHQEILLRVAHWKKIR